MHRYSVDRSTEIAIGQCTNWLLVLTIGVESAMEKDDKLSDLRALARLGRTAHQIELGQSLLVGRDFYGNPVEVDYAEARHWLELAHERGAYTATFLLGTIHEEGLGVAVDLPAAVDLYGQAAKFGSYYAKLRLARIYANERSAMHDAELAVAWYGKVLEETGVDDDEGHAEARDYLSGITHGKSSLGDHNVDK